ncbi:MAG: S26 family signal peptidase [Alphaproteobacteria bacterium]|nr:S26 family signal peptidase [Alphaproteobacteria bacterium]
MRRCGWIMATCVATLSVGVPMLYRPIPQLIWNASASVPIGLYRVIPAGKLRVGELVVVQPTEALAEFLADRRYLAMGVPLLKYILALPGQMVCRMDLTITVDGTTIGRALELDHAGRGLPKWDGCKVVPAGEVFFMNWRSDYSFDGRYFGPLPASTIVGRADPLWIQKDN